MKSSHQQYFIFFVIGLFLLISGPALFSEGMFLDGTLYAAVARNLSIGQGGIWNLHYTNFLYDQFNEHPPLAFWLQSLFFKLFGDSLLVERLYSLCTFLLSGFLLTKIWKKLQLPVDLQWLPLLFFVLMPLVPWCAANNLLENTMLIFVLGAFIFFLNGQSGRSNLNFLWCGFSLALAFLTKGFTGLFLLAAPVIFYLFGQISLRKMLSSSAMIVVSFLLFFTVLFVFYPEAWDALERYFHRQVLRSLQEEQTVSTRFYILWKSVTESLIPLAIILLLKFILRKKELSSKMPDERVRSAMIICIGYLGILPIVISLKQSGFYILTALPFLALGMAMMSIPLVQQVTKNWIIPRKKGLIFVSLAVLFIGIGVSISFTTTVGRDRDKVEAIKKFSAAIPEDATLYIPDFMFEQWSLHAYFNRYLKVSLCTDQPVTGSLYFTERQTENPHFLLLDSTSKYFLYTEVNN